MNRKRIAFGTTGVIEFAWAEVRKSAILFSMAYPKAKKGNCSGSQELNRKDAKNAEKSLKTFVFSALFVVNSYQKETL